MNKENTLFTINYLPSIQYVAHWIDSQQPVIEKCCSYTKRTYRNRCDILGANGVLSLTVPVVKRDKPGLLTKDVMISYDTKWQDLHWRSIISAYNSSPFFEYLMDDFKPFYEQKFKYLFDFNLGLLTVVFDILDLSTDILFTENFKKEEDIKGEDLRNLIHPNKDFRTEDKLFYPKSYRQVFQDRFPFMENLSVIDLIFNKGPEAIDWLEECMDRPLVQ